MSLRVHDVSCLAHQEREQLEGLRLQRYEGALFAQLSVLDVELEDTEAEQ